MRGYEALVIKPRGKNRWKESGASTTEQCQGIDPKGTSMRKLLVTSTGAATWRNSLSRPLGQQIARVHPILSHVGHRRQWLCGSLLDTAR